jgi:hypothetical protein
MHTRFIKALTAASLANLLAALALSTPLLERFAAAAWQWYKFADGGHINLSLGTGMIFTLVSGTTLVVALLLVRATNGHPSYWPLRISPLARGVAAANLIAYWGLGLSNFNVWRP